VFLTVSNPIPRAFATGQNWLVGWGYRKSHVINQTSGSGTLTNYDIQIHVYNGSGSDSSSSVYINNETNADFSDVRFTQDDGSTLLSYWCESYVSQSDAWFWVEIPTDLSLGNVAIYLYYGNSTSSSLSNGFNTFTLFDDFDGALNTSLWETSGNYYVSNSIVHITGAGWLQTNETWKYGPGYALRMRAQFGAADYQEAIGFTGYDDQPSSQPIHTYQANYPISGHFNARTYNNGSGVTDDLGTNYSGYHVWECQRQDDSNARFAIDNAVVGTDHTTYVPTQSMYVSLGIDAGTAGSEVDVDWIAVRRYIYPEPIQGTWGAQEVLSITDYSCSRYYVGATQPILLNATVIVRGVNGWKDLINVTIGYDNNVQLRYVNATNTFAVAYDPDGYCTLYAATCSAVNTSTLNLRISWNVSFSNSMPANSYSANLTSVLVWFYNNGNPMSSSGSAHGNGLFQFINDLYPYTPPAPLLGEFIVYVVFGLIFMIMGIIVGFALSKKARAMPDREARGLATASMVGCESSCSIIFGFMDKSAE
jgi:hypothetical protein